MSAKDSRGGWKRNKAMSKAERNEALMKPARSSKLKQPTRQRKNPKYELDMERGYDEPA